MDNLEIIKLPPDKWQVYKQLRIRALKDDPNSFGITYAEALQKEDKEWILPLQQAADGKDKWLLFAKINDQIVGMVSGTAMVKEIGGVKIKEMFVSKEARGKGIAKKLLTSLEDELKKNSNVKFLRLGVFTSQEPAINLYKKLGFKILETLNEQFSSGSTHQTYYMGKDL